MADNPQAPIVVQRLFFALWPDDALRQRLARFNRQLPLSSGKPVTADNLHITLQFLGNVGADRQEQLETGAGTCDFTPFSLVLDRLGHFARPRVLWLGATETPTALAQLVACLGAQMRACGLFPDTRPYHPHLTLRRKVNKPPAATYAFTPFEWQVTGFALVRSATLPSGVQYQLLRRWGR